MNLSDVTSLITEVPTFTGYSATGARVPYCVVRPLYLDSPDMAVSGEALDWNHQVSIYCCASSVEASYNLAKAVMSNLHGHRIGGSVASVSLGYAGAAVEGHYETQLTLQILQGGL